MPMTKTDATAVNVLLRWIMGGTDLSGAPMTLETARWAAAGLALSANKALTAGVRPAEVEAYFDAMEPRVLPGIGKALAPEVAQLLGSLWSIAECDGGWPGGDTVGVLCEWFTDPDNGCGADITHPAERPDDAEGDDKERWTDDELIAFAADHGCMKGYVPPRKVDPTVCPTCDGEGANPDDGDEYDCDTCAGTGGTDQETIAEARAKQQRVARQVRDRVAREWFTTASLAEAEIIAMGGDLPGVPVEAKAFAARARAEAARIVADRTAQAQA